MYYYWYEITWTTKVSYGTLDYLIRGTSKQVAINRALRYVPVDCIAINAARVK